MEKRTTKGSRVTGGNGLRDREVDDYYATDPKSVTLFLEKFPLQVRGEPARTILEPCCGGGHITRTLLEHDPGLEILSFDIADRGYEKTDCIQDFLTWEPDRKYDMVLTNPPYKLAQEFVEKSLDCISDGGKVAMFLNISFITGEKRKNSLYAKNLLESMYVFGKRQGVWRNGQEKDENGNTWSRTMNFAWFVFSNETTEVPQIHWI